MQKFLGKSFSANSSYLIRHNLQLKPTYIQSLRYFSESQQASNEEDSTISVIKRSTTDITKAHPFFNDKNGIITFVVDYPLFPMSKYVINLNEHKFRMFSRALPKYVATVVRKSTEMPDESNKILENSQGGTVVTPEFHSMGAYCTVEFNSRAFNTLILNSMYRVQFDEIKRFTIPEFDPKEASARAQSKAVQSGVDDHHDLIEEDQQDDDEQQDQGISKREKRLKFLLDRTRRTMSEENPLQIIEEGSFLISQIRPVSEPEFALDIHLEAKLKHIIDMYSKILALNKSQLPLVNYNLKDAYRILDSLGSFLASSRYFRNDELQEAFEHVDIISRIDKIHSLIRKYYNFLEHFADLGQIAQQNINARRAKEFYDEVFRIVKGAVEGDKGKQGIIDKLRSEFQSKKPPPHVVKVFEEESKRFLSMEEMSTESNMIRTYLEWVVSLPYGVKSTEDFEMDEAKKILDEDHFGLEDVKDRILEFIAVGKMKGTLKGKILCLVGPPGVGKTSLASSIARALKRKYARIALGGESDSSTLKGHRKTYIGAYPGKIVQALKECGTENCVILLDEIDKLGRSGFHGDPQSNLLEILDPQQNNTFNDNYLDFPIDLSNVLFICTANITDTIYAPLLDRVDLIQLSSYTNEEKKHIFYRHLYPKALTNTGLSSDIHFKIQDNVVDLLVNEYCREPGVRSLEKHTRKILEKLALQVVEQETGNGIIVVDEKNLSKYVGHPKFSKSRFYEKTPVGVIVGLAYTEYGGSLIYIEATRSAFPVENVPRGGLKTTGSLGNVMKESMQIAYTFAKTFLHDQLKNDFLENYEVHIHAPEGATPKDGPSAGVTITSALVSLAIKKPAKQNIAMTGEISLRGKVLKIGGVKEKILAAKREGIKELIFPKSNQDDILDLKPYITEGMKIHYAETYDQVYQILFGDMQQIDNVYSQAFI